MTQERYIIRDENFGATLYDRKTLTHKFVKQEHLSGILLSITNNGEKFNYWQANKELLREDIIYSPIRIYYEITLKCNLRCKLCYNNSGLSRDNELTTDEILQSLNDIREANIFDVRFTGGELTQRPDWYIILRYAKSLGLAVSCNTNGVYIDESIIDKFANLNLEQVTLSIDGIQIHHNQHRGKNTYEKTLNSLRELHKRNVKLRVNTLISKWSINDLENLVEIVSDYVTEINFFPFRFSGRSKLYLDQSVTFEEYYNMAQEAESIRKKYPHVNIMHFAQAFRKNSIHTNESSIGLQVGGPDGFTRFNIMSDGSLWAGGYVPYIDSSWKMGNVKNDDLLDIWHNSKLLDNFRIRSSRLKKVCFGCPEYLKRCPGSLYEIELFREINPSTKNPFCAYGDGKTLLDEDILSQKIRPY